MSPFIKMGTTETLKITGPAIIKYFEPVRHEKKDDEKKNEFIRPCPHPDCRGFLSTQLKCGLCEKYGCSSCWKPTEKKNDLFGKKLIALYYKFGPLAAEYIRNKPRVMTILRKVFVGLSRLLPKKYD